MFFTNTTYIGIDPSAGVRPFVYAALDQELRQAMTMITRDLRRASLWYPAAEAARVSVSDNLSVSGNSGTVTVVSGALYLGGGGTHSGSLTAQEGAEVRFTGATHTVAGMVTSPDTMQFTGGNITFEPGSTFSAAEKTVVSATVSFNEGSQAGRFRWR